MEHMTITQVSRAFGVSTRTLRYYEQIGLLPSQRRPDYSYRVYGEDTVVRLQQIILLRKLRLSLAQIREVLENPVAARAVEILRENLRQIESEAGALSTISSVLRAFLRELEQHTGATLPAVLLGDESLLRAIHSLDVVKTNVQEGTSMKELNQADQTLSKLTDVRIVRLPPFTVAASHYVGPDPEEHAEQPLADFIRTSGLPTRKPDARVFGFNHPSPQEIGQPYGYEYWVTIPEDMEVPAPLVKKHFGGGLYAAHAIVPGNFHEWGWLQEWVSSHPRYAPATMEENGADCMHGLLEEHLDYIHNPGDCWRVEGLCQIDLLFPVRLSD